MIENPKVADGIGTIVVLVALIVLGFLSFLEVSVAGIGMEYPGDSELPRLTDLVVGAAKSGVLMWGLAAIALGGVALVFLIRDRLRANVTGIGACLLLLACMGVVRLATTLPLIKAFEVIGN